MTKRWAADYTNQHGETKTAIVWANAAEWRGEAVQMRVRCVCEREGIQANNVRNIRECPL